MSESLHVLVVDDEPDVCWVLEVLLLNHGFTVMTMASGTAALNWLNGAACDLILVDAKLGDIDGVELAKRIRTDTACTAPVILVSGYFYKDDSVVQNSLNSGTIAAFITKPFRHEEILGTINAVLSVKPEIRNGYAN